MKKIFTLFAALAMVMSMSAKTLYMKGNWRTDDAWFAAYFFVGSDNKWVEMTNAAFGYFQCEVPTDKNYTNVIFCRMDGGKKGTLDWGAKWDQTEDLTLGEQDLCLVSTKDGNETGVWSNYAPLGTIAGSPELLGVNWDPEATANQLTPQVDGTYTLVKEVSLQAGTYEYKVTDGSWDWSLGNGGENATLTIETEGKYSVTFTYTPASEQVTAVATLVTHTVTLLNDAGAELEGAGQYEDGAFVTVSAPEEWDGYIFVSWVDEEGNGVSDNASTDIQVLEDITLTALYAMMMPLEVTDLEIVMNPVVGLMGSTELAGGTLSLQLVVDASAEGEDGEFPLTEDSQLWLGDTQFEFLEGIALIDMENNAARAFVLAADDWGMIYYFDIEMSAAAPAEPIQVVVENATVTLNEYAVSETESAYELTMVANWTYEKDGLTYEVECLLPTFDPTNESGNYAANFYVRGDGDAFGMTEGANVLVTVENQTLTLTGEISAYNGNVYNVTISGTLPAEEPDYQVVEDEITNFVFDTEAWPMVCAGGPSTNYGIEVYLVLTEEADGTLNYEQSSVSLMGTAATLIDGTLSNIDVFAPAANAVLRVQWNDGYFELHLTMSAAAAEPEEIDIVNAVATYNEGSGELFLTATWTDSDEVTYPVTINLAGYEYKEESVTYSAPDVCSVQIGGNGEDDPWYTYATAQEVVVTIEDQQIVIEGAEFTSSDGDSYYIMITGTLPGGTTVGLDNINTTVAPVKAIVNGQLVIIKNGVQYNAQGAVVK